MKYFSLIGLTVSLLCACDPGDESLSDTGAEGGTSSTGGGNTTLTDGSTGGSGTSQGTGSSGGSGTSQGTSATGETDPGSTGGSTGTGGNPVCEDDPLPEEEAAVMTISIELTNDTASPTYVIASTEQCTDLSVARGDEDLGIANAYSCGCECPGAGPASYTTMVLEPGMSHTFSWDGRAMAPYQTREDCFEDRFCGEDTRGVPQLVEPGPVTLTIPLYDEAGEFEDFGVFGFQDRCVSPTTFTVDVEVGTEDQLIPVALSDL